MRFLVSMTLDGLLIAHLVGTFMSANGLILML